MPRIKAQYRVEHSEIAETQARLESLKPVVEFFPVQVRFAGLYYAFGSLPEIQEFQTELDTLIGTSAFHIQ